MDRQLNNRQYRGEDRPIKGNSTGKYNMNFIDWRNEWETVYGDFDFESNATDCINSQTLNYEQRKQFNYIIYQKEKSPIFGMDKETFLRLVNDFEQLEYNEDMVLDEQSRLPDEYLNKIKKMKMGTTNQQCAICVTAFKKGEVIRKLPCKHIFHDNCILPWFLQKSNCPNCRFDIKEHYRNHKDD